MGIDKKNSEKYPDPTCYLALSEIARKEKAEKAKNGYTSGFKPLVYICSPYAGDIKTNTENAKRYCRFAYKNNAIPLAPHLLYPQFMDDENPDERKDGLWMGLVLLNKCNELWVFGANRSSGMQAEIKKAKKNQMRIRYFNDEMREVLS